jgi:lipopolysaccharide transport system ATP-binding protein
MSSEVAISVRELSKVYRIYAKPEDRLVQMATLGRRRRFQEFDALKGVSLEVRRGETVGIIGRNGCGKSTLLQMIVGTLQPTSGSVEVHGRIAALLELGAGFNGEFTGRENVYMNGAILGFSREEMDARFESIAAFASIGNFIERPVKAYSSGMFVRLAFAVATAVEPDILIVDEALAVGDEAFQRKCFARIEAIKERGGTILFVSHGAQTIVQLCDRAVLLDGGEKLLEGEPKLVVGQYQRLVNASGETAAAIRAQIIAGVSESAPADQADMAEDAPPSEIEGDLTLPDPEPDDFEEFYDPSLIAESRTEIESRGALIVEPHFTTLSGKKVNVLKAGRRYVYRYRVEFTKEVHQVGFGMLINTTTGLALGGGATDYIRELRLDAAKEGDIVDVAFELSINLTPGVYFLNVGVTMTDDTGYVYAHRVLDALAIRVNWSGPLIATGFVDFGPMPTIKHLPAGLAHFEPQMSEPS